MDIDLIARLDEIKAGLDAVMDLIKAQIARDEALQEWVRAEKESNDGNRT